MIDLPEQPNMIAEVLIEACPAGHVHLAVIEVGDGDCGLHGIFTPREAFDLARLLMRAAYEADSVLRDATADVGPCTLH